MPNLQGEANVFLTDDVILAKALMLLKNRLVALQLVTRSDTAFTGEIGDTVNVELPARVKSASGRTLVVQPMVVRTVPLIINKQEHVGLEFNSVDRTLSLPRFAEKYLTSAMSQIAHAVDSSIMIECMTKAYNGSGTIGTATTSNDFIDGRAFMTMAGVPYDMTCHMMNPLDAANVRKGQTTLNNQTKVQRAIEGVYVDRLAGADGYETAQMPVHTVGALGGTPLVDLLQRGSSLLLKGASFSITNWLRAGDVFTIAGVFQVNPRTYISNGILQRFVATAAANSTGAGAVTVSISPELNDGLLTTVDDFGATVSLAAYQNVTQAAPNNAAITVLGTAATAYRQNLTIHKHAVMVALVDMVLPQTAAMAKRVRDPESGLSLMMTGAFTISTMKETYRIDCLWGVRAVYADLIHRYWSAAA